MEITEVLKYIKEFGILPAFIAYAVFYWHKNHNKIIDRFGEKIIIYIKSAEHQKPIEKMFIKKDLDILKYFLLDKKRDDIGKVLSLYDKAKESNSDLEIKDLEEIFKDSSFIKKLNINSEIIERFEQKTRPQKLNELIKKISNTISINGSNPIVLRKLIWSYFKAYIEEIINDLENHFIHQQ